MHIWVVEFKSHKDSPWRIWDSNISRDMARIRSSDVKRHYYKTRVVKYISTKGK